MGLSVPVSTLFACWRSTSSFSSVTLMQLVVFQRQGTKNLDVDLRQVWLSPPRLRWHSRLLQHRSVTPVYLSFLSSCLSSHFTVRSESISMAVDWETDASVTLITRDPVTLERVSDFEGLKRQMHPESIKRRVQLSQPVWSLQLFFFWNCAELFAVLHCECVCIISALLSAAAKACYKWKSLILGQRFSERSFGVSLNLRLTLWCSSHRNTKIQKIKHEQRRAEM